MKNTFSGYLIREHFKKYSILILLFVTVCILIPVFSSGQKDSIQVEWISPYLNIDWEHILREKAQFHTHTTCTDGFLAPHSLVDLYHQRNYSILAVTDHWKVIYPWEEFDTFQPSEKTLKRFEEGKFGELTRETLCDYKNRFPKLLNMCAVRGCEPSFAGSSKHHIISLFSGISGQGLGFDEALNAIGEEGGLISFAHPGRKTERKNNGPDDYIYYLDKFPHIYGFDIFNPSSFSETERWVYCKKLYADLLMHYGTPDNKDWRPVWMTSTDDLHSTGGFDQGLQIQLVKCLNQKEIYSSLKEGAFFWVAKATDAEVPFIESVEFEGSRIIIKGKGFDKVLWYFNNEVVHSGNTFDITVNGPVGMFYLFFTAQTSDFNMENRQGALIGSQPFWFLVKKKYQQNQK